MAVSLYSKGPGILESGPVKARMKIMQHRRRISATAANKSSVTAEYMIEVCTEYREGERSEVFF